MTIVLTKRSDIDLSAVHRVAWHGEAVRIGDSALARIAECRESFLRLIDTDPKLNIYGVTSATGEFASRRLTQEERERHAPSQALRRRHFIRQSFARARGASNRAGPACEFS
jgi:histidine ammonia-lyase